MAERKYKVGDELWLPCQVRPGPFSNERRVYLKVGEREWLGFVNESEIRDERFVKARVLHIEGDRLLLGIRGSSPTSRSFVTERSTLAEHGAVAA